MDSSKSKVDRVEPRFCPTCYSDGTIGHEDGSESCTVCNAQWADAQEWGFMADETRERGWYV